MHDKLLERGSPTEKNIKSLFTQHFLHCPVNEKKLNYIVAKRNKPKPCRNKLHFYNRHFQQSIFDLCPFPVGNFQ